MRACRILTEDDASAFRREVTDALAADMNGDNRPT
jgi:hypothetical protein